MEHEERRMKFKHEVLKKFPIKTLAFLLLRSPFSLHIMSFAIWCYLCKDNIKPFITNQSYHEKQNLRDSFFNHYYCYIEFLLCIPQQIRMPGQPDGVIPV
jgi:hypothetical protein